MPKIFTAFWSLLLTSFLCAACSAAERTVEAGTVVRIMPDELYRYALSQKCDQVSDFYVERPDVREPPFVYGILTANEIERHRDYSAAFWCETPKGGDRKYTLLLKLEKGKWPGGCGTRIEHQDYAGGLSIVRNLNEPLDWYRYVDDEDKKGDAKLKTGGPGIQSIYDGTGYMYYCHNGKWMARPIH